MTENERIKEIRKAKSLTLEKFGERIGIKKGSLSQIENGITNPSEQTRRSICREFNVNEEWLRTGKGEMFVQRSRGEEIAVFLNEIATDDQSFRARLVSVLARLSSDEWNLLEQMAQKLTGRDAPAPEDEFKIEAEELARQLAEEKEPAADSFASPDTASDSKMA